jgi:hypothetical protein
MVLTLGIGTHPYFLQMFLQAGAYMFKPKPHILKVAKKSIPNRVHGVFSISGYLLSTWLLAEKMKTYVPWQETSCWQGFFLYSAMHQGFILFFQLF